MSFQVSLYTEGNRETFSENGNPAGNSLETSSLKALSNKVLQRNSAGNKMETKSFPEGNRKRIVETPWKRILSARLGEEVLLVSDSEDAALLRAEGERAVIYTADEIRTLKIVPDLLKPYHETKKVFPLSSIEAITLEQGARK